MYCRNHGRDVEGRGHERQQRCSQEHAWSDDCCHGGSHCICGLGERRRLVRHFGQRCSTGGCRACFSRPTVVRLAVMGRAGPFRRLPIGPFRLGSSDHAGWMGNFGVGVPPVRADAPGNRLPGSTWAISSTAAPTSRAPSVKSAWPNTARSANWVETSYLVVAEDRGSRS